jgi:hypothetical protein
MNARLSIALAGFSLLSAACSVSVEQPETTLPAPETSSTLARLEPLFLAPDGLGAISFGGRVDEVVADLTSRFGAPDRDTGWEAPEGIYEDCPGLLVRAVGWGSFETLFSDKGTDRPPEFFAWSYGFDLDTTTSGADPRGLDLRTQEDIGLGSIRAELMAAYGARLTTSSGSSWSFQIDPGDSLGMRGLIDGGEDGSRVTSIESAPGCLADTEA